MKTKLLLVDDQEMNHLIVRALVKELPIDVDCALNMKDALKLSSRYEYALILIDYYLGGENGIAVSKEIKKNDKNKECPVIFTSTIANDRKVMEESYKAGAVDFIVKPIDSIILKSKLKIFSLIFEQKRQLLKAKKEADAQVDAKAEFLANMSHEIRTPLNAMIGMVDVLSQSELTYEQRGYLDLLIKGGENLMTLINEILDYSKIEAGHLKVDKTSFDLKELVTQIIDFQTFKANEKNISLYFDYDPSLPSYIVSDSFRLRQVLNNLLSNAIKFTEEGRVTLTVKQYASTILFEVEDTGIGISADEIKNVFKNFSQVGAQTSRRYGGTGLGLYISKGLVEALGGMVGVKSKKGKGSLFYFQIPLEEGQRLVSQDAAIKKLHLVFYESDLYNVFKDFKVSKGYNFHCSLVENKNYSESKGIVQMVSYELFMKEYIMKPKNLLQNIVIICSQSISREEIVMIADSGAMDYYVRPFEETMFEKVLKRIGNHCPLGDKNIDISEEILKIPLKILIVDDVLENRLVLKAYLQNSAFILDFIDDGSFVLEKVKNETYNLILMDMQMPIMDGYEATKAVRVWEAEVGKRTPIVALTAYALQNEVGRCLDAGCDGHLSKPVRIDDLKSTIAKYAKIAEEELKMLEKRKKDKDEYMAFDATDNFNKVDPILIDYIPTYIKNRMKEIPEFKSCLERADYEGMRFLCHKILGSAASYGLYQLEEIINKLQTSSREENLPECHSLIQALEVYLKGK